MTDEAAVFVEAERVIEIAAAQVEGLAHEELPDFIFSDGACLRGVRRCVASSGAAGSETEAGSACCGAGS